MRFLAFAILLGGCSDNGGHRIIDDAPNGGDVSNIDAAVPLVKVTMKDSNGPIANAKVYFQADDSTSLGSKTTDANGVASAAMPNGGFVTLIDPDSANAALRTWAGVKSGDSLIYDTSAAAAMNASVSFTIPRVVATAAAPTYSVLTPCGSTVNQVPPVANSATPFPVVVALTCGPTTDVLVEVIDANNRLVSSFFVADQAVSNGTTVDYGAKTYVNATTRTFTFNNNTSAKAVTIRDRFTTTQGAFFTGNGLGTAANPSIASILEPALPANVLDVMQFSETVGTTLRNIEMWGPTGGTVALDISTMLLPDFAGPPAFDVASHTVAWTQTANSVTPNFAISALSILRGNTRFSWELITPVTTSITFPVLPDDAATYNIVATDTVTPVTAIATFPGGWDTVRPVFYQSSLQPTGATGTILLNEYTPALALN